MHYKVYTFYIQFREPQKSTGEMRENRMRQKNHLKIVYKTYILTYES